MQALVVGNHDESDLGLFGEVLADFGFRLKWLPREDPGEWTVGTESDVLISLGSEWSVYWPEVANYVSAETALLQSCVKKGVPVFGVCFGAQILSASLGGIVTRSVTSEIGWHEVESIKHDSLLSGRWMQWHYDSFSAPAGFEVIATSKAGIQGIRGGRSLGLQFHPEVTESIVSKWMSGSGASELAAVGIAPSDILDETRRGVERTSVATRKLLDWFLEDVAQGPVAISPSN